MLLEIVEKKLQTFTRINLCSRAVWMAAKAANIPVTIRYLDLFKGEHKTTEFAKV
ncbi:hypothetical protein DPMN_029178 [Dreissena polymorpha]|uniref:Uncharacterized protein n=1 Tax=Dreissena polymorpha TaxID=45954 RepID=A0A9D4LYK2_DREPO|nr:hypothetical protein DPMN_029178 [Dreissena polymorpha]